MSYTEILSALSYNELLDLQRRLADFPGHQLLPWIEQEIEIREEQMKWLMEEAYTYAREMQEELY